MIEVHHVLVVIISFLNFDLTIKKQTADDVNGTKAV
jgi:hypothetical protein